MRARRFARHPLCRLDSGEGMIANGGGNEPLDAGTLGTLDAGAVAVGCVGNLASPGPYLVSPLET